MRKTAWLVVLMWSAGSPAGAAPATDCTTEAAALNRDQSELPRLDVTSPQDRPPYCITLETVMAFAGRVKAHVAHCPSSDFAQAVTEWDKTRTDYSRRFSQYRCKRTLSTKSTADARSVARGARVTDRHQ